MREMFRKVPTTNPKPAPEPFKNNKWKLLLKDIGEQCYVDKFVTSNPHWKIRVLAGGGTNNRIS